VLGLLHPKFSDGRKSSLDKKWLMGHAPAYIRGWIKSLAGVEAPAGLASFLGLLHFSTLNHWLMKSY